MRLILPVITILCFFSGNAQLVLKGLQADYLSTQADTVSLSLPFWDDFSTSKSVPDSTKWIYGNDVYVNATLGQNPPTYNVATFDGLNSVGMAYDLESEFGAAGDSLASQFIDLSAVAQSRRSTVYLSFYWQNGGFGEMPDDKDSIALFFRRATSDGSYQWDQKWSKTGGDSETSSTFTQAIVQVDSASYFHSQFQFKFVSYSSQRGPFDTWHIDYVYLNENRSADDLGELDQAVSGSPTPLFGKYSAIPANIFFSQPNEYLSAQSILVSNLQNDIDPLLYGYNLSNLTTGEDYGTSVSVDTDIMMAGEVREVGVYDFSEISVPPQTDPLDSQVLNASFYYSSDNNDLSETDGSGSAVSYPTVDLKVNDTTKTQYLLHNYYAYDDGTAEFAAAINTNGGQLAVRFALGEPDTLTHIDIYLPNIAPSSVDESINITVWNHLGTGTNTGILTSQSYPIEAPAGINTFRRIKLAAPLLTGDTIYIGFRQGTDNYIGVGFDRNNPLASSEIYTNTTGSWQQNDFISGALMIRPVFAYDSTFTLSAQPKVREVSVYPNPSSGQVKVKGRYETLSVYNLSGKLVFSNNKQESFDLSFLRDGIYLLKINSNQHIYTQKLIIRR